MTDTLRARSAFGLLVLGIVVAGCGASLPEPESESAQLYVKYCSGSGCHGPIPPQVDTMGYWNNQYDRMIVLMKDENWPLPTPEEDRKIRAYIEKHALKP
ncbi:MAG TPA: hypothetical protein VKA86_12865 [Candidatus Krumholzibacteria bacterium]|nr:hypothetical protein [Candidatus Krumholzibacteria bacterium]